MHGEGSEDCEKTDNTLKKLFLKSYCVKWQGELEEEDSMVQRKTQVSSQAQD